MVAPADKGIVLPRHVSRLPCSCSFCRQVATSFSHNPVCRSCIPWRAMAHGCTPHGIRYATELLLVHQSVHHRTSCAARILSINIPQTISSPRLFLHFPMQADGLAFISEPDFAKACRSLVHQSRETDLLRMTLRLCPEVLVASMAFAACFA